MKIKEDSKLLALFLQGLWEYKRGWSLQLSGKRKGERAVMKVLIRIGGSVLMILLLSIGFCYAQNVAGQSTAKGVDYAAHGKFKEANG